MKKQLTILLVMLCICKAYAVLVEGVAPVAWWPYANAHSLVISDYYLYCSSGNALLVVDITDPASPEKLGELIGAGDSWSGGPNDGRVYAVNGDYLYVAQHDEGLVIVNISSPGNPSLVTRYDPGSLNINSVAAQGDYVYLATNEGLKVLQVTDPANPFEVGSLNCGYGGLIVSGDFAYYNNGPVVRIINITNPSVPEEVGSCIANSSVYDLALDSENNRLFGACYGRVDIIDVSVPSLPSFLGYYSWGSNSYSTIAIWDHYLAVSCHDIGIEFVDVAEPSSPVQLTQYSYAGGYPRNPIVSGDYLYLSIHYRGIEVINVRDPNSPSQVAVYHSLLNIPPGSESIPFYGRSFKVATSGNTACVVDDKGLLTFDVTNPYQPELESYLNLEGRGWGIDMVDNIVYCATTWAGFNIVNVAEPSNPELLTHLNLDYYVDAVTVQDHYAYIASEGSGDTGIKVFNVLNPSSIVEEGAYFFSPGSYELDAQGDYLYVAGREAGLRILNISNLGSITQAGQYLDPTSMTSGVDAVGDYAYICESGSGGFKVINVSEPSTPFLEGTCTTPYHSDYASKQVEVSGNLAYVVDYVGGLRIIDVTEPSNPFEVGYYDREDYQETFGVAVVDSLIYLAQHAGGLEILMVMPLLGVEEKDYQDNTAGIALTFQIIPNPFNTETTIRYQLPAPDYATLKIYNITGQLVRTLLDDPMKSGYHSTVWNGRNNKDEEIGSGLYFICLKTGSFTTIKKVILLK